MTSLTVMPAFLAKNKWQNPVGPDTMFHVSHNTKLDLFPYLIQHPKQLSNFNSFMGGQRQNRKNWYELFPMDQILFDGFKGGKEDALLLDIGGGRGHDLQEFRRKFPEAAGKLILQDLPEVIDDISDLNPEIVRMKYDFFTPQPIKGKHHRDQPSTIILVNSSIISTDSIKTGAKAYYLRSILHDWADSKCREILRNIVSAMTKGYSKLIISEWVLPDTETPLYPALLDINMMAFFSGMERTQTQWTELLASEGLEVVKFWSIGKEVEGLIVATLKA